MVDPFEKARLEKQALDERVARQSVQDSDLTKALWAELVRHKDQLRSNHVSFALHSHSYHGPVISVWISTGIKPGAVVVRSRSGRFIAEGKRERYPSPKDDFEREHNETKIVERALGSSVTEALEEIARSAVNRWTLAPDGNADYFCHEPCLESYPPKTK